MVSFIKDWNFRKESFLRRIGFENKSYPNSQEKTVVLWKLYQKLDFLISSTSVFTSIHTRPLEGSERARNLMYSSNVWYFIQTTVEFEDLSLLCVLYVTE